MRFEGTLTRWNDERGFGFITPQPAGHDVFVHVSAFARDGRRPVLHDAVTFEITQTADGKKQAMAVRRVSADSTDSTGQPSRPATHRPAAHAPARRVPVAPRVQPRSVSSRIVLAVVACAVMAAAYWNFERRQHNARALQVQGAADAFLQTPAAVPSATPVQAQSAPALSCDGRQYCSQMTSCGEARYFLKNCPGVKMDGNHDGVPCQEQWCTSPLSP